MTDRTRIILGMSDSELLLWWSLFGYCPHPRHEERLRHLIYAVTGRVSIIDPPIDPVIANEPPARKVG